MWYTSIMMPWFISRYVKLAFLPLITVLEMQFALIQPLPYTPRNGFKLYHFPKKKLA